jgi:ubiquinol-cytochrome c reductase subunit 6
MSIENKLIVKASDESEPEELIDPQEVLREECTAKKCSAYENTLKECNDRVNSRSKTAETCMDEVIDFMHCVDHCVAKTLFSKLK